MASKLLRCFLLITFLYAYTCVVLWYQETQDQHPSVVCHRPPYENTGDAFQAQSHFTNASLHPDNHAWSSSETALSSPSGCQPLFVDGEASPQKSRSDPSILSARTVTISIPELVKTVIILINALTILDIVLSRRTKPWKFILRVLYRLGRSNLNCALLWLAYEIWFHSKGTETTETFEIATGQSFITTFDYMHQIWTSIQSYPILLTATFFIYNFMVSWVFHRLIRRGDDRNATSTLTSEYSPSSTTERLRRTRRILSAWTLLVDCLFGPLSFDTAQSLMDFELDESLEFLIERLALPNLWLSPTVPSDYVKYLPVWQYSNRNTHERSRLESSPAPFSSTPNYTNSEAVDRCRNISNESWNSEFSSFYMKWIPSTDCAICLDKYRSTVSVCGLPCGHLFHQDCIMVWLQRDNHHCPICRWPAYRNKISSVVRSH